MLIFVKCTFERRPVTFPLGERELYKVSLCGNAPHRAPWRPDPPPATGKYPVLLHQGLAWGIRPLTLFILHFLSFPSTTQIFPSQYPVYSSLTAPKIQLPASQLPIPWCACCSLRVSVQSSDPEAGGCCCPGSPSPASAALCSLPRLLGLDRLSQLLWLLPRFSLCCCGCISRDAAQEVTFCLFVSPLSGYCSLELQPAPFSSLF